MISSALLRSFILCFTVVSLALAELAIIPRSEWGALSAKEGIDDLKTPIDKVIICHSATDPCDEKYHMEKRFFDDIGYNFIVGNDGNVYEGRGWDRVGAHTKGHNVDSIGIAFMGTFDQQQPTDQALNTAQELIAEGVRKGKILANYKLLGQRQLSSTNSPGDQLYSIIQTWPHWSKLI